MKIKASNNNLDDIVPLFPGLLKSEQQELQGDYRRVEVKGGGITFYDFIKILRSISISI